MHTKRDEKGNITLLFEGSYKWSFNKFMFEKQIKIFIFFPLYKK